MMYVCIVVCIYVRVVSHSSSGLTCWTANRCVWGSNPGQGTNLVWDFSSIWTP